jgi:hypothetical protein
MVDFGQVRHVAKDAQFAVFQLRDAVQRLPDRLIGPLLRQGVSHAAQAPTEAKSESAQRRRDGDKPERLNERRRCVESVEPVGEKGILDTHCVSPKREAFRPKERRKG